MRVLITGANGFVGQHMVRELIDHSFDVIGVVQSGQNQSSGTIEVDLTQKERVHKSIDYDGVDGVIHLAGLAALAPSFDDPLKYIEVNSAIQINLMETALEQKRKPKFVIISSGSVYGPSGDLPMDENSVVKPSSPYAVSKIAQEYLAQYYIGRGLECVIIRPFNHIGPGQSSGFIVPDLASQILEAKNKRDTKIKIGDLTTKRDYTDVRDIVRAYRLLLEKGRSGEIYNVCSGSAISGQEILNQLMELADIELSPVLESSKKRPVDSPVIYGDFAKLKKETGWMPKITLEQTLADVLGTM